MHQKHTPPKKKKKPQHQIKGAKSPVVLYYGFILLLIKKGFILFIYLFYI